MTADGNDVDEVDLVDGVVDLDLGEVVPDDLAAALRRAADAVPPADLHPSEPRLRHAARRRRRTTVVAVLSSAAVLVVAVLVTQAVHRSTAPPSIAVADRATATADGDGDGDDSGDGGEVVAGPAEPLLLPNAHAELLPDGSVDELPLAREGDAGMGMAARLPDGRLVTLATRDLTPGADRVDGAMAEGLAFVAAVFDADGGLQRERDVRRVGENVHLVGVRDDQVVLARTTADGNCCGDLHGVRLSTLDPDSLEETPLTEVDRWPGEAAVAGDRLVLVSDGSNGLEAASAPGCEITVVDLTSGDARDLPELPCLKLVGLSVSPDGSQAAVVVNRRAGITATNPAAAARDILDQAVVFVGLDDGEVRGSWRFDITPACPMVREDRAGCGAAAPVEYRGLQWVGDDRVDLVVQDPDPNPDPDLVDLGRLVPERLRTIEVEVPSGG